MSITARILLGFAILCAAGLLFLLNPILDRVERQYLEAAEEPMVDAAEILAALVAADIQSGFDPAARLEPALQAARSRELRAAIYDLIKDRVSLDVYFTDANGLVLYDSAHPENVGRDLSKARDVHRTLLGQYGTRSSREDEADATSSVMYVAAPILIDGVIRGVLTVYKPQRSLLTFISETRSRFRLLGFAAVLGVMIFGVVFAKWVTRPLEALTEYARNAASGKRGAPPRLPGVHLSVLADALHQMREALENRNYVENYVQTLTHEMKGPLAAIRGAAEILEEHPPAPDQIRFLGNIREETARLQRIADQMLSLAELEKQQTLSTPVPVDLHQLAQRVVAEAQSRSPDHRITFTGIHHAECLGDPMLLETALSNLIQNAIAFSPEGGAVHVRLEMGGGCERLIVEDEGPGIADYALPKVFDRFFSLPRPATGRKSSGLGLCFVREAVELHHGSATVANRTPPPGTVATITLPLRSHS